MGVRVRSCLQTGRLLLRRRGLRAGAVVLALGQSMDWHSTEEREELLILLSGRLQLEADTRPRSRVALRAGQCAYIPPRTWHRVLNRTSASATYVYVTAPRQSMRQDVNG
jgi:mannose-6-phosphate isomerase-like protein (cupin superfamily)